MNDAQADPGDRFEADKLPAAATQSQTAGLLASWIREHQDLQAGSPGAAGYDLSVGRYLKLDAQEQFDDATVAALRQQRTTYWDVDFELPPLLAAKLRAENGLEVDPRSELLLTSGITPGIDTVLSAFLDPGDEVVTMDPDFVTSFGQVYARGGRLVIAPAFLERRGVLDDTRWSFDPEGLESAITPRTKLLLYTNPNNPMGYVYSAGDLRAIADIATRHGLVVIENQCYERLVYSDSFAETLRFTSLAALPGMRDRVVTVQGVSKGYHLSGYRVGWIAASAPVIQTLAFAQMWGTFSVAPTITQFGVSAAMRMPLRQDYTRQALEIYRGNVDYLCATLAEIPEVECARPAGGPFCFMDVTGTGLSDVEITQRLYAEGVRSTFGSPWGLRNGVNHVRLALSNSAEYHRRCVDALAAALRRIISTRA